MIGGFLGEERGDIASGKYQGSLGLGQKLGYAKDLAQMEDFTAGMGNYFTKREMDADPETYGGKISAEEANEQFQNVDVPFEGEVTRGYAKLLDEQGKKKNELRDFLQKADTGFWTYMGGGLMSSLTEPVNIAADIVGVGLVTKIARSAKMAKFASGMPSSYKSAIEKSLSGVKLADGLHVDTLGSRMGREVVGGMAGMTPVEAAHHAAADSSQYEHTLSDTALNYALGGLVFPTAMIGAKAGMGKTSNLIKRKFADSIDNKQTSDILIHGKEPNTEMITKHFDEALHASPDKKLLDPSDYRKNHNYHPVSELTVGDLKSRKFFTFSKSLSDPGTSSMIKGNYGKGAYLVDNPSIANNYAAIGRPDSVVEMDLDFRNLRDIQTELTPNEVAFLKPLSEDLGVNIKFDSDGKISQDSPVRNWDDVYKKIDEIAEDLPPNKQDLVYDMVEDFHKENGFDGLVGAFDDMDSNMVVAFEKGKNIIANERYIEPDKTHLKEIDGDVRNSEINRLVDDNESNIGSEYIRNASDKADILEENLLRDGLKNADEVAELDIKTVELERKLEGLKQNNPELARQIEPIKKEYMDTENFVSAMDRYSNCILGA